MSPERLRHLPNARELLVSDILLKFMLFGSKAHALHLNTELQDNIFQERDMSLCISSGSNGYYIPL